MRELIFTAAILAFVLLYTTAKQSVDQRAGDGRPDFGGSTDTAMQPSNNIGILLNNGSGGLTALKLTAANTSFGTSFGGCWGDFNAEGRPDFLGFFSTAPAQVVFYNNGNNGFLPGVPFD